MTLRKSLAIICVVYNLFVGFDCLAGIAKSGLAEFILGEYSLSMKIFLLVLGGLKTFILCKSTAGKSRLFASKACSIISLFFSVPLLIINFVVFSPVCEVSETFTIVFSGGLEFLNNVIYILPLSSCVVIYFLGTIFCCLANIFEAIAKNNHN